MRTNRPGFNQGVHGARGLFAFLVFVFHVVNSGLPTFNFLQTPAVEFVLRTEQFGVELFFCVSGYVIVGTLRRAKSPAAFLEDRAIRIYPVLGTTVLAIVALGLLTGVHGFADASKTELLWRTPVNMLGLPGVFPFDNIHPAAWSLSFELVFYALCAAGWALRRPLGGALPWLAAPVLAVLVAWFPRAMFFGAGALVATGWPRHPALRRLTRFPSVLLALFLLCWGGVVALTPGLLGNEARFTAWRWEAQLLAVPAFLFAWLGFAGLAGGRGGFVALLRTRPLLYLGTISYSFYLWHPIVMSGVKTVLYRVHAVQWAGEGAQLLFFVLALPPAVVIADVSERFLERRVAVWLRARLHHPPPMQPAALPSVLPP